MNTTDIKQIKNFGELKKSGYRPKSLKEELRENLIEKIKRNEPIFTGIVGYDETVIPAMQRAILSKHNIILLGLRGQAKTRIARQFVELLDEYIPMVAASPLNDDPFKPVSVQARRQINQLGDKCPIEWLHRSERYAEKLATPDVSVADLIGDIDPIKAATQKLSLSDEEVIHYGIIPRSNRCIFTINELPDLQPRIQVSLFNILEEGDIQIRAFKLNLPLDMQFIFTANPEDYTNRGSIVTPLKDRIESQILTHYPKSRAQAKSISAAEADTERPIQINTPDLALDLIEQIAIEARQSEYVDEKSGVSARMTISALENLLSAAELRAIKNDRQEIAIRMTDFLAIIPSITGKIELVYEGEQEGASIVARNLIAKAIRSLFSEYFPDPSKFKKRKHDSPFLRTTNWFAKGQQLDITSDLSDIEYEEILAGVPGLNSLMKKFLCGSEKDHNFHKEFILHGLSEHSLISRTDLSGGAQFKDLFSSVFSTDQDIFGDE